VAQHYPGHKYFRPIISTTLPSRSRPLFMQEEERRKESEKGKRGVGIEREGNLFTSLFFNETSIHNATSGRRGLQHLDSSFVCACYSVLLPLFPFSCVAVDSPIFHRQTFEVFEIPLWGEPGCTLHTSVYFHIFRHPQNSCFSMSIGARNGSTQANSFHGLLQSAVKGIRLCGGARTRAKRPH
jgi:hypothetical protein